MFLRVKGMQRPENGIIRWRNTKIKKKYLNFVFLSFNHSFFIIILHFFLAVLFLLPFYTLSGIDMNNSVKKI